MSETSNDVRSLVVSAESKLREVAPQWLSVERLTRLALAARSRNPALAECTADSFVLFCMRCAETGLEPIGAGGAWPVPYRNKNGTREVQFIPDWRGLIFLAKKSGQIKHAYGDVVHENDVIEYQKGDDPKLLHRPALKSRGEVIGAYCVAVLPDDTKHIEYMPCEELEAIRARSKAKDSGPWQTDTNAMYIKTVVRRALKPFAASPQMQTAIHLDNMAVGLDLASERPPISMPKIKNVTPAHEPAEEVPENKPETTPEEQSQDTADGELIITGMVEAVTEKHGEGKKGPWTKYGVKIGDAYYGTFDTKLADKCRDAQENAEEVTLSYAVNSKGYNDIIDVM